MTVFSYFDEIIAQINQKIKVQREKTSSAIDIPDWEEAQNVIKQAYENTAALKILKSKVSRLKNDFESSGLFDHDQSEESNNPTEPAHSVSQPPEEETAPPDAKEEALAKENENPIPVLVEKTVSSAAMILPEETSQPDKNVSTQEPQQIKIPDIDNNIPDEAWLNLSEDYQNTKIKAVRIDNKVYYVKNMTDALINVCEWLWKRDSVCFTRMLDTKIAHGKRLKYFSLQPFDISHFSEYNPSSPDKYYKKLSNAEVYVWVNTNSNAKANLMANMLTYYGLPTDTVKLAVRENYLSKERDYSGRTVNQDIGTSLLWQDDPTDTHIYSTPTIHEKKQTPASEQDVMQEEPQQETPQAEANISKVVESNTVVQFCEKMILKRPHKMMIAFTSSVVGGLFENRKNRALSRFQSPHRLSNGVWVETKDVTEQQLKQIEKYCGWKVL